MKASDWFLKGYHKEVLEEMQTEFDERDKKLQKQMQEELNKILMQNKEQPDPWTKIA